MLSAPKAASTGLSKAISKMKTEIVAKSLKAFNTLDYKPLGLVQFLTPLRWFIFHTSFLFTSKLQFYSCTSSSAVSGLHILKEDV